MMRPEIDYCDAIIRDPSDGCPSILILNRYMGSLPIHLKEQLVRCSQDLSDVAIWELTRDKTRFSSQEKIDKWLADGKVVYMLTDEAGENLLGIFWIHGKQLERNDLFHGINPDDYQFTSALRLYGGARGVGLSGLFQKIALKDFLSSESYNKHAGKGIWIETKITNTAAIVAASRLGFQIVSGQDTENRVILVATHDQLRQAIGFYSQDGLESTEKLTVVALNKPF